MKWTILATSVTFLVMILGLSTIIGEPISQDTVIISTTSTRGEGDQSPGYEETSEYMMGEISVSVILPGSDGEHEAGSEDWNSSEELAVQNGISEGLRWWIDRAEEYGIMIDFTIGFHTIQTGYEPIRHKSMSSTEGQGMWLWIDEIMADLGHTDGYHDGVISYVNEVRDEQDTDWAFVIFVVDSSEDPDGKFSDDKFAFSYLGGPFFIMTYDNSNYGVENMDAVTAHETGHIFYALDQYSGEGSAEDRSGYLNVENRNHVDGGSTDEPCIMRGEVEPFTQGSVSNATMEMIGWKDTDGDNIPDILDTIPSIFLINPINESHESMVTFNGTTNVSPYPNSNPYGSGNDVTINFIDRVEYRIDDNGWQDAIPKDGTFDQEVEEYTLITGPLSNGDHILMIRVFNDQGNVNITTHEFEVNVTHPPKILVKQPLEGTYSGDITIDWNATDEDGEITGILLQYIFGGEAVNISGWIDNDPPYLWNITGLSDGEYLVQILARDNSSAFSLNTSSPFIIDLPHAPTLTIINPTNNELDELEGIVEIIWTATDEDAGDSEDMIFDIHLSQDGLVPLITLVEAYPSSETHIEGDDHHYLWDTERSPPDESRVPDGEYLLIITATDPSPHHLRTTQNTGPFTLNNNDAPSADFNISSYEVLEDDPIFITIINAYDPDGDHLEFHWDLGDGQTMTTSDLTLRHTYTYSGHYTISLDVSDGQIEITTEHSIIIRNIAPAADAGDNITIGEDEPFTLSAAATTDTPSDLDTLIYRWEILDSQYFMKDVELSLTSGHYQAMLQVSDDDGALDSDMITITVVNIPPVAQAGYDQIANVNEDIRFNASASSDSPSDQGDLTYHWDFGDGNERIGISPVHSYASPGDYTVLLTVTDNDGDQGFDTVSISINLIPVAAHIDSIPDRYNPGGTIYLSAHTTTHPEDLPLMYIWDLGNGITGYGIEVTHTYDTAGLYRIQLEIQDLDNFSETDGSYYDTLDIWINSPPVPDLRISGTPRSGETMEFDATKSFDSDGAMTKIMWDFGDGTQEIYIDDMDDPDFNIRSGGLQQGMITDHVYDKEGEYTVTLTILDNDGYSSEHSRDILVEEKGEGLADGLKSEVDVPVIGRISLSFLIPLIFCIIILMLIGIRSRISEHSHTLEPRKSRNPEHIKGDNDHNDPSKHLKSTFINHGHSTSNDTRSTKEKNTTEKWHRPRKEEEPVKRRNDRHKKSGKRSEWRK